MSKTVSYFVTWLLAATAASAVSCGGGAEDGQQCNLGELGCACNNEQCLASLICVDALCVADDGSDANSETDSASSTSEESSDAGTTSSDSSDSVDTSSEMTESEEGGCVPPESLCNGLCVDLSTDEENCGECGKACKTSLETGGCSQGACQPVWSDCVDASSLVLCPAVCQMEGFPACVTAACGPDEMSVMWYSSTINCESEMFPNEGKSTACETEPMSDNSNYYRCCCAQQ